MRVSETGWLPPSLHWLLVEQRDLIASIPTPLDLVREQFKVRALTSYNST
jgi:hypothetical protein